MNIKLNIPYSNKDKLKKYKIKWNNDYKIWYLEDYRNLIYLIDYLENRNFTIYVTEKLYIVEGFITCWKCSKMILVYAFGALKSSFLDCEKNIGNLIQNLK
ncbi:hypothetical protein RZU89_08910 [Campylobacter coli]